MAIQLEISPKIIINVASIYTDVNRVFLEYIDNALDSAEGFYDRENNTYIRPINIEMNIIGNKHSNGKVVIKDNCAGIDNLPRVVNSIGDSEKKSDKFSNGQFGYGIYSFMAFCEKLQVTSKLIDDDKALSITINKDVFDKSRQNEVQFEDPLPVSVSMSSGVEIELTNFKKDGWKQINAYEVQREIELHFEMLLSRKNLKITLNNNGIVILCNSYNYDKIEGEVFPYDPITRLMGKKGRKAPQLFEIALEEPIKIYLKLAKGVVTNKPPVFIKSGRRIAAIKDVKSFKSNHKSDIWSHPNLTGYIDLGTSLSPTIARTDFKNDLNSRAVFGELSNIEEDILLFIKDINKESNERHYTVLEDHLNKALSKLARLDAMSYRTDYLKGGDLNLDTGGSSVGFSEDEEGSKDRGGDGTRGGEGNSFGENPGDGLGLDDNDGNTPSDDPGDGALNKEKDNPFEDSEFKGKEKKKSGFNIRLIHSPPPIDNDTGETVKSLLNGSEIILYTQHEAFASRVKEGRKKEKKISSRLITYLAGEITVHYKDKFHNKKGQPDYGKYLFEDLVNFIYKFEEALSPLIDQNLSEFSS